MEHLATLGLALHGKSVLEVGAGIGDLTGFFLDRDCTVTCIEPRPENCQEFAERIRDYYYTAWPRLFNCDVESLDRATTEQFDIVFCYGLLYHVADPAAVLKLLAERCTGLLLLETMVSRGSDDALNAITEDPAETTQSFHGGACRPTRPWVFNRLRALFPHVYMPATQPAHLEFPCDWTVPHRVDRTRAVFVASRQPLDSPLMLDHVPDHQRPA
jgi:SAM-dependent methyltransferase